MYLYFDKNGVLKEIINDESLRQGNYGVNKLYIYVENRTISRIEASFLLESGAIVSPTIFDTVATTQIPYDPKRDLKFFKYYTDYLFHVVDLSAEYVGDNGPLDEAGVVHSSLIAILAGGNQLTLGDVNFVVETNAVLNTKNVASQQYLSLADYLYLKKYIFDNVGDGSVTTAKIQDYAVTEVKIAQNAVTGGKIQNGAVTNDKLSSNSVSTAKIQDSAVTSSKIYLDPIVTQNHTMRTDLGGDDLQALYGWFETYLRNPKFIRFIIIDSDDIIKFEIGSLDNGEINFRIGYSNTVYNINNDADAASFVSAYEETLFAVLL